MNKDNAISKINSIGKAGSIISKIGMIVCSIGVVVAIVCGIFFLVIPKNDFVFDIDNNATFTLNTASKVYGKAFGLDEEAAANGIAEGSVDLNGTTYSFTDVDYDENTKIVTYQLEGNGATITSKRFAVVAFIVAAYAAINCVLFTQVKKLCDSLKDCQSPFEESIISGIQRCAWVLIPWAVFGGFLESVMATVFTSNIKTGFDLNIPTLLVILLLFGLAYVFKYGAVLQRESDETL